jgi:hypothetical protein
VSEKCLFVTEKCPSALDACANTLGNKFDLSYGAKLLSHERHVLILWTPEIVHRMRAAIAPVTLCISVGIAACEGNGIGTTAAGPPLGNLQVHPDTVQADDFSYINLRDSIPPGSGVSPSQVVFASTAGVFAQTGSGTVTIATDSSGVASVQLRVPRTVGSAQISAAIDTVVQYRIVNFVTAEPDDLQIEPSVFGVKQGDTSEVVIRVLLLRTLGFVSPGVVVSFTDTTNGHRLGTFGIAAPSDDSGIVRVRYTPRTGTDTVTDTISVAIADTIYATVIQNGITYAHGSTVITVNP